MIILTLNIRGRGCRAKRKIIGFVVQREKEDICFLQETKLADFDHTMAEKFWGSKYVEWSSSASNGASGGMVILSRNNLINPVCSFKCEGFMRVNALWRGMPINFINIYASCSYTSRRSLWKYVVEKKKCWPGENWCLGGNFNTVLEKEERVGIHRSIRDKGCDEFRIFVAKMELVDLPLLGGKFTWYSGNGKSMRRLDRFLVSEKLIIEWKLSSQKVGKWEFSDYCAVWLVAGGSDWGPKLFRFNNVWLKHKKFTNFMLYEKLKRLKAKLRVCN